MSDDKVYAVIRDGFQRFQESGDQEALTRAEEAAQRALKLGLVNDPAELRVIAQVISHHGEVVLGVVQNCRCEPKARICKMNYVIRSLYSRGRISGGLCKAASLDAQCHDWDCPVHQEFSGELSFCERDAQEAHSKIRSFGG